MPFQLGFQEIIFLFIIALIVFGPKRLPELGKSLGKGLREFKRATNDLKANWEDQIRDAEHSVSDVKQYVNETVKDVEPDSTPLANPEAETTPPVMEPSKEPTASSPSKEASHDGPAN